MQDADEGDVQLAGKVDDRGEHGAHIGGAEAVDLADAEVGRDRIHQHHPHIANGGDLLPQQVQVADQAEHALAVLAARGDHLHTWTWSKSAPAALSWGTTVVARLFGGEDDDVAFRRRSLSDGHASPRVTVAVMNAKTWPLPSSGKPARMPSSPIANRLGHSQVMMRITTFAAHTLCNCGGAHLTQGRARRSAWVWPIASQSETSLFSGMSRNGMIRNLAAKIGERAADVVDVLPALGVVVLGRVDDCPALEPAIELLAGQVARELAGAVRIGDRNQPERCKRVTILLAFGHIDRHVERRCKQLAKAIGK